MATIQLSAFCKAAYVKQQPLGSQPKFLKALFESAETTWSYSDDYGRKLSNGTKELTQDVRDMFPAIIDAANVTEFLREYLTDTTGERSNLDSRCTKLATKAGLSTTLTIDPDAFIPALGDWFQAIIKNPTECDILATAYQRRLEDEVNPDLASFTPLYARDMVIISKTPKQQSYFAQFWGGFSHEWPLQNTGALTWLGRSLRCVNPTDNGVQPSTDEIPLPDASPQGFAKVASSFGTRARIGNATSQCRMLDIEAGNCFPNHRIVVVATPNAPKSEAK